MRFSSRGEVVRTDLHDVRRLVPALRAEWAGLRFGPDGRLLHADTGTPLTQVTVRLAAGRHREPGAQYAFDIDSQGTQAVFTLAHDDGRTIGGTIAGGFWQVDVELGGTCSARGTLDVGAMLAAQEAGRWMAWAIGSGPATGEARVDLGALEGRRLTGTEFGSGSATMRRGAARASVDVRTRSTSWAAHLTLQLHGRGVLARTALLLGRRPVRRAVTQALDGTWADLATQAQEFHDVVTGLDARFAAAGGPGPWLHQEIWRTS